MTPPDGEQFAQPSPSPSPSKSTDLQTVLDGEAGFSEWGNEVSSDLDDAFQRDFSGRPFFREHSATIASDCRESVCRVDLRMAELDPSMPDDERAALVLQAERELLALAGRAGIGRVSTVFNTEAEPPSVALLIQKRESAGGDAISSARPYPSSLPLKR